MRHKSFFLLGIAEVTDKSYTTRGSDPTAVTIYNIRPLDGSPAVKLQEFFGEWTLESEQTVYRLLDRTDLNQNLISRRLPTLDQIEAQIEALDEEQARNYVDDGIYGEA